MKKLHNILVLLILLNMPTSARAVTVGPYSGRVVDGQTGEPVVGASVLMYWEKRVIYPPGSRSELMGVKLVYTDDKGNYNMPQAAIDIGLSGHLANTNLIIYQPGYQANIRRIVHDGPYEKPVQDLKTKDNLIKLQRIPPKFDHRKHRDSIEDALRGLDYASEYLDKDAMTGRPINVSPKVQELIDSSKKTPKEFLVRTKWEERRYSSENMATAIEAYCGIHDFNRRTFIVPDESTWEPNSRAQYEKCIDATLQELKNRDPWIRLDAVYKLGAIKARKTIPAILVVFKDMTDWRHKYVQQECVLSISRMAPESNKRIRVGGSGPVVVSPAVISSNGRVISNSTSTVIKNKVVKKKIVPIVPEENRAQVITAFLEKADDSYLKKEIIEILGSMHAIEAEKLVKDAIQDPDEEIRGVAVTAIFSILRAASGKEHDSGAIKVSNNNLALFIKALKDPSANVRLNAVYAVSNVDSSLAVDALISALSDNDERIKSLSIKKLSAHNDIRILKALAPLFNVKDYYSRKSVRESFADVSKQSSQGMIKICQNESIRRVLKENEEPLERNTVCTRKTINPIAASILLDTFGKVEIDAQMDIFDLLTMFEDRQIPDFMLIQLSDASPHIRAKTAFLAFNFFGPEVIPHLITLVRDKDDNVRVAALDTLAKYSDTRLPDIYLSALQDPSKEVKQKAISIIQGKPDKRAVETLLKFLSDDKLVFDAVPALGAIKNDRAVKPLVGIMNGTFYGDKRVIDVRIRQKAAEALGWEGNEAAVPALLQMLKRKELEQTIIISLGLIKDKRAVPALRKYATGSDKRFTQEALQALKEIHDVSLMDIWKTSLEGEDREAKNIALEAIGTTEGNEAFRVLLDKLDSPDEWQRKDAVRLLGKRKERAAVRPLLKLCGKRKSSFVDVEQALKDSHLNDISSTIAGYLRDDDLYVRKGAVIMLMSMGDQKAIKPLKAVNHSKLIIDADFAIYRIQKRYALPLDSNAGAVFKPETDLNIVKQNLRSLDPAVRRDAVKSIMTFKSMAASDDVIPLLQDKSPFVRASAAYAFVGIRNPKALEPLTAIVGNKEENDRIRTSAASALGIIGDPKASDELIAALNEDDADIDLKREAIFALKKLGGEKAVGALKGIAERSDETSLKNSARTALFEIKVP